MYILLVKSINIFPSILALSSHQHCMVHAVAQLIATLRGFDSL